jgi:hypothetical protein
VTSGGGCLLPLHSPIARTVNFREDLPHICSESVRVTHPRQRFQIPNSPCMRSWVLSVLRMGLSRSLDIFGFSSLHLLLFRFRCQTYHKKFDLERLSWMSSQPIRFSWQSVVVLRLWFSGNWFSLLYARFPDPSRPGSRPSIWLCGAGWTQYHQHQRSEPHQNHLRHEKCLAKGKACLHLSQPITWSSF